MHQISRLGILFFLLFVLGNLGCQSLSKGKGIQKSQSLGTGKKSGHRLTKKQSRRLPAVREMDQPSNVLRQHKEFARSLPEESTQIQGPVELTDKEKLFFELAGEKVDGLKEIDLYNKVVEAYRKSDEAALEAFTNLLLKKYPRSIYCDNALYFQGMLYFWKNKYGESLNAFQRVLNQYPQSNKAVSALYGKGIVFRKMNLNKEAVRTLAQVINHYPGSPESERAQVELKLITR